MPKRNNQGKNRNNQQKAPAVADADSKDVDKDAIQKAVSEFNSGYYKGCLVILKALRKSWPQDSTILHNEEVCEYYISNLSNTAAFKDTVMSIIETNKRPESDQAVLSHHYELFNLAVVYFHEKEYILALERLRILHESSDTINETLAVNVSLLLAECHLMLGQTDKTFNVLTQLEKNLQEKTTEENEILAHAGEAGTSSQISYPQDSKTTLDIQRSKHAMMLLQSQALILHRSYKEASKAFKKIIQEAADANQHLDWLHVSKKSQLKFLRGRFSKSRENLDKYECAVRTDRNGVCQEWPSDSVWYNNNLSLIMLGSSHYTQSLVLLLAAIKQFRKDTSTKVASSVGLYNNTSHINTALHYNLALACLRKSQASEMLFLQSHCDSTSFDSLWTAFNALTTCVRTISSNPRLWLHLAQTCIAQYKKLQRMSENKKKLRLQRLGKEGAFRFKIVKAFHQSGYVSRQEDSSPRLSLTYGKHCIEYCLKLLNSVSGTDHAERKVVSCLPSSPSMGLRVEEVQTMRCCALASAAYITLCLGDYEESLCYSRELLQATSSICTPLHTTYRYLGSIYSAECLVMLGDMEAAVKYLDISELQHTEEQLTSDVPEDSFSMDMLDVPLNSISQKHLLHYNLSLLYAIKGDYKRSTVCLQKILSQKSDRRAVGYYLWMLQLFLAIKTNNLAEVKNLVQSYYN